MSSKSIVKFNPKLPKLSANEQKVLKLLIEAAELIVPLYELQENYKYPGANFYPHGISEEEIREAAIDNPAILSPYTVVEKKGGKLVAIPYHEKYAKLLEPIATKLVQAAKVTDNQDYAKRLEFQAEALLAGNYDEAQIYWMSMKPYVLDINIGPVERYDDRLCFVKTSYQAWVGVWDTEETKKINKYKEIILSSRRKIVMPTEKVDYYDKVQIRVNESVVYAGRITKTMPYGINLPNDPNLMEIYGSEITVSKQPSKVRFDTEVWPMFNKIFDDNYKTIFSADDLEKGLLYSVVFHELAHTYLRYRNSERNLETLFPIIDELAAYVMGIKMCGNLLLKDVMTQKELESIMIAFVTRCFHLVVNEQGNLARYHTVVGAAIFLNYLFESGAIKESGGLHWPNLMKMFMSLEQLASVLERLLYQGSRRDAEVFIKEYGNFTPLQRFAK